MVSVNPFEAFIVRVKNGWPIWKLEEYSAMEYWTVVIFLEINWVGSGVCGFWLKLSCPILLSCFYTVFCMKRIRFSDMINIIYVYLR